VQCYARNYRSEQCQKSKKHQGRLSEYSSCAQGVGVLRGASCTATSTPRPARRSASINAAAASGFGRIEAAQIDATLQHLDGRVAVVGAAVLTEEMVRSAPLRGARALRRERGPSAINVEPALDLDPMSRQRNSEIVSAKVRQSRVAGLVCPKRSATSRQTLEIYFHRDRAAKFDRERDLVPLCT
jgi:hypothetical protein